PLHVLGLRPRGPRGDAARPLGVRSRRRDEPGEDLPWRRYLRGDPDGAHQARARGGHVDLMSYDIDGMVPRRSQRPSDTATLARCIGDAHEAGEAAVRWGDGTVARAGGRVVKNVTGYDLARLYSGTFGTLAVLAEVSLKLSAIDEAVRAFRVDESAYEELRHLPLDSLVLATGHTKGLYARVAGLAAAVERLSRELARYHATEIGPVAWDQTVHPPSDAADLVRASVPPWREREVAIGDAIAYLGTGIVFLLGERSDDDLRALRARCARISIAASPAARARPSVRPASATARSSRTPAPRSKRRVSCRGRDSRPWCVA